MKLRNYIGETIKSMKSMQIADCHITLYRHYRIAWAHDRISPIWRSRKIATAVPVKVRFVRPDSISFSMFLI